MSEVVFKIYHALSARWLLWGCVVLLVGAGCSRPDASKGAHPDPKGAIKACQALLKNKPSKVTEARVRALASTCGKLLSEPACRKSWAKTVTADSVEAIMGAQNACLCVYCPKLKRRDLTFCSLYCRGAQARKVSPQGASPEERSKGLSRYVARRDKLWDEIRHYEWGGQCALHRQSLELLSSMFDQISSYRINLQLAKPPARPEPTIAPQPAPPMRSPPVHRPLDLQVFMTDEGFYIKSRHGAECPAGAPKDKKICFPKLGRKFGDLLIHKLQLHMWFLFASKYKDPKHYSKQREKHSITLIPEPTIKYDDIVRTFDALREIPRDAKHPPAPNNIPASGCAMKHDKKSGGWGFVVDGSGTSVRDRACMYYIVTLALGSS